MHHKILSIMKVALTVVLATILSTAAIAQISTYPYFTGFEGTVGTLHEDYPTGWTSEDLNTNAFNAPWQIIKNSPLATNAHTDSSAVHIFSNAGEANNDWLFTPGFEMQQGMAYTITFWYSASSLSTAEKLKIHVGSNAASADMLPIPIWQDDNITTTSYIEATATYQATSDGTRYFGFHCTSEPLNFILFVDDVTVDEQQGTAVAALEAATPISIAPNPCNQSTRIAGLNPAKPSTIRLFKSAGQLVQQQTLLQNQQLNAADLPAGWYSVQVEQEGSAPSWKKLVVMH